MTQTPNSALPAKAEKEPKKGKRTEAVALMIKVWLCALILEAVHLILSVVLTMFNRSELFAQAEETAEQAAQSTGQELSDSFVQLVAYGSVAFSSFISLAIVVLLGIMLWLLNTNSSAAGTGRRLWFAFSLYFGFRVLLVFFTSPAGAHVPDWLFVLDAGVQILAGVTAVMGLIFCSKEEVLEYTGEMEQMRQIRKELEDQRRQENQEKRDKDRTDKKDDRS